MGRPREERDSKPTTTMAGAEEHQWVQYDNTYMLVNLKGKGQARDNTYMLANLKGKGQARGKWLCDLQRTY